MVKSIGSMCGLNSANPLPPMEKGGISCSVITNCFFDMVPLNSSIISLGWFDRAKYSISSRIFIDIIGSKIKIF